MKTWSRITIRIDKLYSLLEGITMRHVTKIDLKNLDKDIKHQIETVESQFEHENDKMDFRVKNLEKKVESFNTNMKWVAGVILTYLTVLITFVQFIKH